MSIVLENPLWEGGNRREYFTSSREIRPNFVPLNRLVSRCRERPSFLLTRVTIEFFEVAPTYWSRTNNPASSFSPFFLFSPRDDGEFGRTSMLPRGWTWISRYFSWFYTRCQRASGLQPPEMRRRFIGCAAAERRKNNRVPRAENLARLNRQELPLSAHPSPLFPDGFFFRDVLTIEIARGRDHGSFLRASPFPPFKKSVPSRSSQIHPSSSYYLHSPLSSLRSNGKHRRSVSRG